MWWSTLTAKARTGITLALLAVLMLVGVTWGWAQVSKPFPGKVDVPLCVDTSYSAGDELFIQDVTVSVLNASTREGLAGRTLAEFTDAGFAEGQTSNAPQGTALSTPAEIWVSDPASPAAKLVRKWVGKVPVRIEPNNPAVGVTVVVGDQFDTLRDGPQSVELADDAVVCSPPVE